MRWIHNLTDKVRVLKVSKQMTICLVKTCPTRLQSKQKEDKKQHLKMGGDKDEVFSLNQKWDDDRGSTPHIIYQCHIYKLIQDKIWHFTSLCTSTFIHDISQYKTRK